MLSQRNNRRPEGDYSFKLKYFRLCTAKGAVHRNYSEITAPPHLELVDMTKLRFGNTESCGDVSMSDLTVRQSHF